MYYVLVKLKRIKLNQLPLSRRVINRQRINYQCYNILITFSYSQVHERSYVVRWLRKNQFSEIDTKILTEQEYQKVKDKIKLIKHRKVQGGES